MNTCSESYKLYWTILGEDIKRVITQRSRGHKRHGDLASVQQALSSPPKPMRLPNSPMPISPSYKAKQAPKFKTTGLVSTSGTYVPPKAHPLVGQQRSTDVLTNSGRALLYCDSTISIL